ncbi:MAG: MarC family protein [Candidatus Thermoplasmatota archaeon]|nr:MarC family protein [Candidatus Thermoplasmatota archaeon]
MDLLGTLEFFGYVATALFAIMNPVGAVPTTVFLTEDFSVAERVKVIKNSIFMAGGMLFGFILVGVYIFEILGISINDFKIAGGFLLFKVAFDMLQGKTSNTKLTKEESMDYAERDAVGIVPIGTPLLAGPGSITTAILLNSRASTVSLKIALVVGMVLVLVLSYVILYFSTTISRKLGKTGTTVISRIMGLLLASIAVELITSGIIAIVQGI